MTCDASRACRPNPSLSPLTCSSHCTLQQLDEDDLMPLCANLGRFKRLKEIYLVSRGVCERGAGGAEGGSGAAVEGVTCGCGGDGGGGACNGLWCSFTTS